MRRLRIVACIVVCLSFAPAIFGQKTTPRLADGKVDFGGKGVWAIEHGRPYDGGSRRVHLRRLHSTPN